MSSVFNKLVNKYNNIDNLALAFNTNAYEEVKNISINELVALLEYASEKYYHSTTPFFKDSVYDVLIDYLENVDPKNKYLQKVGSEIVNSSEKEKLPFYMASMKKVKLTDNSINNWFKKYSGPYVVSDKLDGTSGMIYFFKDVNKDDYNMKMFTRGDHNYGRNITHLLPYLFKDIYKNPNKFINSVKSFLKNKMNKDYELNEFALRGEIILTKEKFEKYRNEDKFKSSSRTIVNSLVIQKTVNKKLANDACFMIFEIVEPRLPKTIQFELLKHLKLEHVFNKTHTKLDINNMKEILDTRRNESSYDIDGIIIEDNGPHNLANEAKPDYAFAFKTIENIFTVKVEKVEYQISKDGILVPRIYFEPINYKGDILRKATGFNARFIKDNGIGPGAVIKIIRAGEIIPKVEEVVSKVEPFLPTDVEYKWNSSGVDIILNNYEDTKDVKTKLLVNFFTKMKISFVSSGIIEKLFNAGYTSISSILNMSVNDFCKIEGFKDKMAQKIHTSINSSLEDVRPEILMAASNSFGKGFGTRKIKMVFNTYPNIFDLVKEISNDDLIEKLNLIEGFSNITSKAFVNNFNNFCVFLDKNPMLKDVLNNGLNKYYKNTKKTDINKENINNDDNNDGNVNKDTNHPLYQKFIVMTGFRNKDLNSYLEENYSVSIQDSINKKTNILITKTNDTSSSKYKKATSMDIEIYTLDDFTSKFNINL